MQRRCKVPDSSIVDQLNSVIAHHPVDEVLVACVGGIELADDDTAKHGYLRLGAVYRVRGAETR